MSKVAFITGITGQDGSYLADLLLSKGYTVYGLIRRSSVFNTERIEHIYQDPNEKNIKLHLPYGDMLDSSSLSRLLHKIQPDEIYNLAAQSHVKASFEIPEYTCDVDALGTLRLLESIRSLDKDIKFYQASTSEMFGGVDDRYLSEMDRFYPKSPYACAKVFGYNITVNYRESYGIFATNGILFNHESERRGKRFVTRKITRAVSNIYKGRQDILYLGNLDAKRDWGYAPEYVEAMWMMLQHNKPDDFVIATGETHTVREFVEKAFEYVGYNIMWCGNGINEKGIDKNTNRTVVKVSSRYLRPTDTEFLCGNPTKAINELGWKPKIKFNDLVSKMMEYDLNE